LEGTCKKDKFMAIGFYLSNTVDGAIVDAIVFAVDDLNALASKVNLSPNLLLFKDSSCDGCESKQGCVNLYCFEICFIS